MSARRESTLLWSVAGALLLAAGVVVVIAMRRSDETPLPAPPIDTTNDTATAEAARTAASAPLVAAEFARADVPVAEGAAPAPPTADTNEVAAAGDDAENVAVGPPPGAPNVPPAASALQGLHLAVPIAQVLDPGTPRTRPALGDQRLNWMENLASSQAAEIRRVEAALAAEAQAGPIHNERIRRQRLDSLKRVHSVLSSQVAQARAERGLPPN